MSGRGCQEKKNEIISEIIHTEDIYKIINHVQTCSQECFFITTQEDSHTIENILKDISAIYEITKNNDNIKFHIKPSMSFRKTEDHFMFEEELEDELPEDGQCF